MTGKNRWAIPGEWYDEYIMEADPKQMMAMLVTLRDHLEDEDITDAFSEMMEEWGYFVGREDEYEYRVTEADLIRVFNESIRPAIAKAYGPDDKVAMREAFNNWTDSLCKDGIITVSQYDNLSGPPEDD